MDWLTLSIMVALLGASAFFAASETALTGASRASMLRLSKQGNRDADVVSSLIGMRERLIGALLLGNNIANIGASALATGIFTSWFGDVGVLYATAVMTVLVVIFVEVVVRVLMRLLGLAGEHQAILSPTERLRGAVDLLHHEGKVEKQDRDML